MHPGLGHFHAHLTETVPTEFTVTAQASTEALHSQWPTLGHLLHMVSHMNVHLGQHGEATKANMYAIQVDELYAHWRGTVNCYFAHTLHTHNPLLRCSEFDGQFRAAIDASEKIIRNTPRAVLSRCPAFVEPLMADVWCVLFRSGRLAAILNRVTPESLQSRQPPLQ